MLLKHVLDDANDFSKIIYTIPYPDKHKPFWKIRHKLAKKKHWKTQVKPTLDMIIGETTSFHNMCEFGDFLKQMECTFFYNNSIDNRDNSHRVIKDLENGEKKLIVTSDNSLNNREKKFLLIIDEKENVAIKFTMYINNNSESIIDITVHNEFANKLSTKYHIVDADTEFDNIHHYNLLNNVNYLLRRAMHDTFLSIYNQAVDFIESM